MNTTTTTTWPSPYLADGILRVCAICNPGSSIFQRFPLYRELGLCIGHGYCAFHAKQQMKLAEEALNDPELVALRSRRNGSARLALQKGGAR